MRATFTAMGLALVLVLAGAAAAQAALTIAGPAGPVDEPGTGSAPATFTVSRSGLPLSTVTVTLTTADVTATAPADYTPVSQTVTLGIAQSSATVSVPVLADALDEADETFTATLSAPSGDTLGSPATASATIVDDPADLPPAITAGTPAAVTEGTGAGGPGLAFPVDLSAPSGRPVSVDYATSDGTATAGSDYTPVSGTLVIPAGQVTGTVLVPVNPDTVDEDDETVTLTLATPVNAVAGAPGTQSASGTITDDDTAALSVTGTSVVEGGPGTSTTANVVIGLSTTSTRTVTVAYGTIDGTATKGSDYVATQGIATIPAGSRTAVVPVTVLGDALAEGDETLTLAIAGPTGGAVIAAGGAGATITIRDDDAVVPLGQVGTVTTKPGTPSAGLPAPVTAGPGRIALGRLRYARTTGRMSFAVACPAGTGRCRGTVTVFTVPARRSVVRELRRERRLGTARFDVAAGTTATSVVRVSRAARGWVRRARRVKVTAFAVSVDARGTSSTAKVGGILRR